MFQEELEKRDLKIVELQEQVSKMERASRTQGSDLSAERSRADEAELKLKQLESDQVNLKQQLSAARKGADRAAEVDRELAETQGRAQKAMEHVKSLSVEVDAVRSVCKETELALAEERATTNALSYKLEHLLPFLNAVRQVHAGLVVIGGELTFLENYD